eukprot:scaffold5509_cov152-Skeletonema_menzelii.AAC.3
MLSKLRLRSKKGQFEAYDVTISLISCTNLKISGAAEEAHTDVKLYASFVANNAVIPLTIDGIAGNTHDTMLTLPVQAAPHTEKRESKSKLFSFMKRKTKGDNQQPYQPVLMKHFDLQLSAQGAKLNVRVQVRGRKGDSSASTMVEEGRHDVDTRGDKLDIGGVFKFWAWLRDLEGCWPSHGCSLRASGDETDTFVL